MNDHTHRTVIKALWQVPLLFIASTAVGLFLNAVRPDSLPVIGGWSVETRLKTGSSQNLLVSLEEAERLCTEGKAIFIDARSEKDYAAGHIKCALNLPWHGIEEHFAEIAERINSEEMIIIYCDGETCSLSKDLALFLRDMGFKNARVLVNGWSVWQEKGLPTESL